MTMSLKKLFPTSDNLLVDILSRPCIWVLLGSLPSQLMKHRTELRKPAAMIERISDAKRGDGEIYLRYAYLNEVEIVV